MENAMQNKAETPVQNPANLPTTPETLLKNLDNLGIGYEMHHHPAVFTVEESSKLEVDIPGAHCRNLFLRDHKKRMFLVVLQNETQVNLKSLEQKLDCGRLSFGSADRLWQYLGVWPGSVTPFSIINDVDKNVRIILDADMMKNDIVNYHPLINTMTIGVHPDDLVRFIETTGHSAEIMDLKTNEAGQ